MTDHRSDQEANRAPLKGAASVWENNHADVTAITDIPGATIHSEGARKRGPAQQTLSPLGRSGPAGPAHASLIFDPSA